MLISDRSGPRGDPERWRRSLRRLGELLRIHRSAQEDRNSLRTTVAILKAQQEATLDGILVVGNRGQVLSYNRRFLEIWGVPPDEGLKSNDAELLRYAQRAVVDWDAFIADVQHLYDHPNEVRTNDLVALKDGRIISRASVPVVSQGKATGRAWYFRDITEQQHTEKLQSALFRIADVTRSARNLDELYPALHHIVGELMDARNFYIALYDRERDMLSFPYFIDEKDERFGEMPPGRGLTGWVLRNGEALLVNQEQFAEMVRTGEVEQIGAPSVDWLGVPLKTGDDTWGVLGVQTYHQSRRYGQKEKEILQFVSQHVATGIEQVRKDEAIRASEIRYRQMFENNRAVQFLVDPDTGRLLDVNAAAAEFYGYSVQQLRAMSIWDISTMSEQHLRRNMLSASQENRSYFVSRHRLANGQTRDVEVHTGPIDIGGRRILYTIIHDISERRQAEMALVRSEQQFRNIFDFAPVGILQSTRDGTIVTANAAFARILGYDSVEDILSHTMTDLYCRPEDREELIRQFLKEGFAPDYELPWKRKDGSAIWVQLNAHAITRSSGELLFEDFVYDITERKQAEETLRKQSAAMTASMDGIAILNERAEVSYLNDAAAGLYGYISPQQLIGRSWSLLFEPAEFDRVMTTVLPIVQRTGHWRGEATGLRRDGGTFPQEISITSIDNGGMVCVVRDITERTHAEEQIKHLAYHDALTGLPNRMLFKDRLTVALSRAQRDRTRLAVLFLDLDRFKVINDSLGHNIGDQLLQAVAWRVLSCLRDSDTVARLGGDEFTLLLPHLVHSEDAARVAEKILEVVRHPITIEGREFFITTSLGISLYPEDGSDSETLIKNADTAMYQAKEQGRDNYQLFNAFVNAKALQRITLEHGLRKALLNEELVVYYQPIFDLRLSQITGMEALLRWNHPEYGIVSPGDFIPQAETAGLMVPIGLWVLRTACTHVKSWHDRGYKSLSLAVNLSVSQLQHPDVVDQVSQVLDQTGMPGRLLELEITESSAMQSPENGIRTLYDLKKLGLRISLDDFGTGHSSLSYLKRFPIDTLKIDQSFVRDITTDPDTAAIVSAIIAMTHSLRLKVIAEGVEFAEQAQLLKRYACDQMQGFLIMPPVPAEEFERLLLETGQTLTPRSATW